MVETTTGAEFKRFYADPLAWPEDRYHDDTVIRVNGEVAENGVDVHTMADDAVVLIEHGYVLDADGREVGPLPEHFANWRKTQRTTQLVVECPLEKVEAVRAAVLAAGGVVRQG